MDKSLYTKPHVAPNAATGALGRPSGQVNFGTQFVPTDKFSIQGNREFDTLSNAEAFVYGDYTAFPGIIITISEDGVNNGAYLVENSEVTESNPNGLKMTKLAQGGESQEKLEWDVVTDEEVTPEA